MLVNYTSKELDLMARLMRAEALGGVNSSLFYGKSTTQEKELAERCLRGEYYYPATHALWFYAPPSNQSCKSSFYSQPYSGKYKNHCFYKPDSGACHEIY